MLGCCLCVTIIIPLSLLLTECECVCVWLWGGSWWVVVVWAWAGGWVVCMCGAGVVRHVAQVDCYCCHTKQCARCRLQAVGRRPRKFWFIFAVKHNEKAIDNTLCICYIPNYIRLCLTISHPSHPIISHHIPPYPTVSHHIKTGISQRYTPEGSYVMYKLILL